MSMIWEDVFLFGVEERWEGLERREVYGRDSSEKGVIWVRMCNSTDLQSPMIQPQLPLQLPTTLTLSHFAHSQPLQLPALSFEPTTHQIDFDRLHEIAQTDAPTYPISFVQHFLLVKLNNLLQFGSQSFHPILPPLCSLYNALQNDHSFKFSEASNDSELMAQLILAAKAERCLSEAVLQEILEGCGLVAATAVFAMKELPNFLVRSQKIVVMGLVSLHARTAPFLDVVHQDKNHAGQIQFARTINSLIHLREDVQKKTVDIVQDSYSLRCTPQVHGVVYDCLQEVRNSLPGLVNRPQTRTFMLDGRTVRNLALRANSQVLQLDNLVLSINEIGHMSFLRAQRMQNKQLGRNQLQKSGKLGSLRAGLQRSSYKVSEDKLLTLPTNSDTVLMDDYRQDVFSHEGLVFKKLSKMIENTRSIMELELRTSSEVLLGLHQTKPIFESAEMQEFRFEQVKTKQN